MKILINIIALLVLTVSLCSAQDWDFDKMKKEWTKISADFEKELQKDSIFKNLNADFNNLHCRIVNKEYCKHLFEIEKKDYKYFDFTSETIIERYEQIRTNYIKELEKHYTKVNEKKPNKESEVDSLKKENARLNSTLKILRNDTIKSKNDTIKNLKSDIEKLEKLKGNYENFWYWKNIALMIESVFLIILIILVVSIKRKGSKKKHENDKLPKFQSENFSLYEKEISKLKNENSSLKSKLQSFESNMRNTEKKKNVEKKEQQPIIKQEYPKEQTVCKYLCRLTESEFFGRIADNYNEYDSYYRIKISLGKNLRDTSVKLPFEFYSVNHEMAIQNWSSILSPAADWSGDYRTAKRIETVEPGVIQYDSSAECWKIVKKAKLKLY